MSLRYLLDTNVLSEGSKAAPNLQLTDQIETRRGEIATASPVWHELWFGCRRLPESARRRSLERYLRFLASSDLAILAYDPPAAEWHARERARLSAAGKTPSFVDGQIAAVAAVNGLTLVTANIAHFRDFEGLEVEDWSRP